MLPAEKLPIRSASSTPFSSSAPVLASSPGYMLRCARMCPQTVPHRRSYSRHAPESKCLAYCHTSLDLGGAGHGGKERMEKGRRAGQGGKENSGRWGGRGERREGRKGWREGRKEEKGRKTIILPEHSNSGSVHTRRSSDGKTYSPHFLGYARQCWEAYRAGRRCSSAGAILPSGFPAGIQQESCVQAGDR